LGKKVYFASDFHLGVPTYQKSLQREKLLVNWLNKIKNDAAEIYLMGDIFDFWFEYKTVVPKGFVRLLGKLAEIRDSGIPVHLFKGNHDLWAFDYLQHEVGLQLHSGKLITTFGNKTFFLAHGDGLGPGDTGYKILKKVFENKINQWLFRWLHPDIGTRMGLYFSRKSRYANENREARDGNPEFEDEMLYRYCVKKSAELPQIDYFIFGHRHLAADARINNKTRLIILGDWISYFSYAVFDGDELHLKYFNESDKGETKTP
jgi:UDP-2,3-diacylglucosamine hydrolase